MSVSYVLNWHKICRALHKDYASRNVDEDTKENIRRKPLAQCIRENINEDGIKTVAERAAWLGNDEVHYFRRWDRDKDLDDLIALIDSVANWIVIHTTTEELKTKMLPR
jgi:hypothetical protein